MEGGSGRALLLRGVVLEAPPRGGGRFCQAAGAKAKQRSTPCPRPLRPAHLLALLAAAASTCSGPPHTSASSVRPVMGLRYSTTRPGVSSECTWREAISVPCRGEAEVAEEVCVCVCV